MIEKRKLKKGFSYKVRWWQEDGKERSKTHRSYKAAVHFERTNALSRTEGTYIDPLRSKVTAGRLWTDYIVVQESRLKPKTLAGYAFEWKQRIEPRWGDVRVDKITHEEVASWVLDMRDSVGASSVRYAYRCLSLLLDYAVRLGRLSRNPAKGVPLPALETKPHRYLTVAQVEALSAHCASTHETYGDLIRTGAYLGLRAGEATGLRVRDVSVEERRVHIRRNVTAVSGHLVEGTPKSKAGVRKVPVPEGLVAMLRRRILDKALDDLVFSAPTNPEAYVRFENLRRDTNWKKVTAGMGLEDVNFHSLRHTYASLSRRAGADLKAIQKTMGHASITTTASVYADLFDDELTIIANKLDRLISETAPAPGADQ